MIHTGIVPEEKYFQSLINHINILLWIRDYLGSSFADVVNLTSVLLDSKY